MTLERTQRRRSRALTLLEALVVIAAIGVIGGVIIRLYIETDRATRLQSSRDAVVTDARAILEQMSSLFRRSASGVMDEKGLADVAIEWRADRCALPIIDTEQGPGIRTCAIVQGANGVIRVETTSPDGQATSATLSGPTDAPHANTIRFRYATALEGAEPLWRDGLTDGDGWPLLVEAVVTVVDAVDPNVSLRVETVFELARPHRAGG